MTVTPQSLETLLTGTDEQRVEALRSLLNYPIKLKDPQGSDYWYLRSGEDEDDAEETCPIAVNFCDQCDELKDKALMSWLTEPQQDEWLRGHYLTRIIPDQPVLYILLPKTTKGQVAFILPSEGKLRRRNIQVFAWGSQALVNQFQRLTQGTLTVAKKIKDEVLGIIPQVDWIFYPPAKTAQELAQALAKSAKRMEEAIPDTYDPTFRTSTCTMQGSIE